MNKKRELLITEEPKHKKKSTAKGMPRSNHKHEYKTVLLHEIWNGKEHLYASKVCIICILFFFINYY